MYAIQNFSRLFHKEWNWLVQDFPVSYKTDLLKFNPSIKRIVLRDLAFSGLKFSFPVIYGPKVLAKVYILILTNTPFLFPILLPDQIHFLFILVELIFL